MEHTEEVEQKKSRHRKKQLYKSIREQMEFYFSDANISKDRFLSQLINQDPCVDLPIFLKFNKIRKLTENIEDIQKAVSKSEVLELSEDKTKICRKTPINRREDVEDCTIYVERLKSDATHEWLTSLFSEFGKVTYVSLPRYKSNGVVKGFAFVEFENKACVESAVQFFESIGCKMPSNMEPQNLCSIVTYEGDKQNSNNLSTQTDGTSHKRSRSESQDEGDEESSSKRPKVEGDEEKLPSADSEAAEKQTGEKKKTTKKKNKNKIAIKELGLQILTKKEWKKMRNNYLDLQKKKMKELKKYLSHRRFSKIPESKNGHPKGEKLPKEEQKDHPNEDTSKAIIEFIPGVIVKVILPEPYHSNKNLKHELRSQYPELKYIDIPTLAESNEVFLRFSDSDHAKQFSSSGFKGECHILEGSEEKQYWEKILNDRDNKLKKNLKKQRGREKLLKRAEREKGHHIRFEDK